MFPKSTSLFTKLFRCTHKTIRNPKPNRTLLGVDRLEDRLVPSTATLDLADHILRVQASDGADNIQIYQPGDGSVSVSGAQIAVTDLDGNTTLADTVTEDQVAEIDVNALRGDDSIYVGNAGAAAPIPVVVNGGAITFASTDEATVVSSAIQAKYDGLGGVDGFLGQATADEADAPGGGRVATFAGGSIYYTNSGDTWAVSSATQAKYDGLGGAASFLGEPTADETDGVGGGRVVTFQGGAIYSFADTGTSWAVSSATQAKYDGLGGSASFLGEPTADEADAPGGGRVTTFTGGAIYTTVSGDAWAMSSAIQAKYASVGGGAGYLGQPTADETDAAGGGRVVTFQGGAIYNGTAGIWLTSPSTAAIQAKYAYLGGAGGILGAQTAAETDAPNGGRMVAYQHGRIYWSTATGGAWAIDGAIKDKYIATASMTDAYGKSVQAILGLPTSDEITLAPGVWVSHFQHGDIYARSGVGVFAVYGAIWDEYNATASLKDAYGTNVQTILKLPSSDEVATAGGGRVVHFQGGDIYANLGVGAYAVYGAIKDRYNALGGPGGKAGLPTSDEQAVPGGRVSRFAGADLYAIPGVGVYEVNGAIRAKYNAFGGASSLLGLPITDEVTVSGGWYNHFQHGSIFANHATGEVYEVHGLLRDRWASLGWSDSLLGFPTSDEFTNAYGWEESNFQNGNIYWRSGDASGTHLGFDRTQVIGALKKSEANNLLDGSEWNFFHNIATDAQIFVPDSVRNLTHKLIDGDPANARFQGAAVGNLHAGSPAYAVDDLERKWFEGQDHPNDVFTRGGATVNGGAYSTVNGPLFGTGGPLYTDVYQTNLGDCTLIASLAEVAAQTTTIQGMFTNNGDGTYTVQFFHNGAAEYVTVDRQLPSGGKVFDSIPSGGAVWAALAEKAYAQLNESGWLGTLSPGQNSYGALDNGNGGTVQTALTAITGRPTTNSGIGFVATFGPAWAAGALVVLGTPNSPPNSLVEHNHAYAVIGYSPTTQTYVLFNPWGVNGGYDPGTGGYRAGVVVLNASAVAQNFSFSVVTGAAPAPAATPAVPANAHPTPATTVDTVPNRAAVTQPAAAPAAVTTALPPVNLVVLPPGDPRPTPSAPVELHGPEVPAQPATPAASEAEAPRPAADRYLPPSDLHDQMTASMDRWAVALDV